MSNEDFEGIPVFVCNDAFLRAYSAPYWVTGDPNVLRVFRGIAQQTNNILAPHIFSTMGGDEDGITYLDRKSVPNADEHGTHQKYPLSFDLEDEVYDGSDTVLLALQVAVWMGFATIYLLGADYGYTEDQTHFYGKRAGHESVGLDQYPTKIRTMTDAVTAVEGWGIKVFNCSRDSKLMYPKFKEIKDAIAHLRRECRERDSKL